MDLKPVEGKLLKGLSVEQRLEVATRALCDVAREMSLIQLRLLELTDRLEGLLYKAEARSWENAIRERMEELKKDGVDNKSKMAAYKKSSR